VKISISESRTVMLAAVLVLAVVTNAGTHIGRTLLTANILPSIPDAQLTPPTSESLYGLDIQIQTSAGTQISLASAADRPRIATLFYTSCPVTCPLTIATMQSIDSQLTPQQRNRLGMLMVSFDPANDSPQALAQLENSHGIDTDRWLVGRTSPHQLKQLAAALDQHVVPLADGSFDHRGSLVLLDATGRILARTEKMGAPDPAFLQAVRSAVETKATL